MALYTLWVQVERESDDGAVGNVVEPAPIFRTERKADAMRAFYALEDLGVCRDGGALAACIAAFLLSLSRSPLLSDTSDASEGGANG